LFLVPMVREVTTIYWGNLKQEPEHLEEDKDKHGTALDTLFCAASKLFTLLGGWAPQEIT